MDIESRTIYPGLASDSWETAKSSFWISLLYYTTAMPLSEIEVISSLSANMETECRPSNGVL